MMENICLAARPASLLIALLCLNGCNNSIPGVSNFSIGVNNDQLTASFLATQLKSVVAASTLIPGLSDATFSIAPSISAGNSTGTLFSFSVSLTDLSGTQAVAAGLPDGRSLPDVVGGELPRWDFEVSNQTIYVYLADQAFAMFIPVPLENASGVFLGSDISINITDERGNDIGKAYAIAPASGGSSSGIFILIPLEVSS